ncbi:lipopolysaccharide biosynthesis protein [Paenibacillus terrigena]|uniref:lipopolysaccharide biosynthesis protein n=1 Tax=Paenibacillus terrigena TaxID=369333 RepID=UPI0028D11FDE|nr:lipopolysaccharide biosynthesis protein [Paenibacillus terrigena]
MNMKNSVMRWRFNWKQGSFMKNVLIMLSGTATAQAISILATPILARLYTPTQYGQLSVYMSLLSLAALFSGMGYERAIPMEKEEKDVPSLLMLCMIITVFLSVVLLAVVILLVPIINKLWDINGVILLLPLSFLGYGLYNTLSYWALRTKSYGPLSRTKWVQGIGSLIIQLISPFVGLGKMGLLLGDAFGRVAGTGTLLTRFLKSNGGEAPFLPWRGHGNKLFVLAKRYRQFPIYVTGGALFNAAVLQSMPLFMSTYYSLHEAGAVAMVDKILGGPLMLLGMSISQVFYAEAMELSRTSPRELERLFYQTFKKLCKLGIIPILLIMGIGPFAFQWVFGNEWADATKYIPLYAMLYGVNFLFSPLSSILESLRLQKWLFWWNLARFFSFSFCILTIVLLKLSAFYAVMLYTLILISFYIIIFMMSKRAIARYNHELNKNMEEDHREHEVQI